MNILNKIAAAFGSKKKGTIISWEELERRENKMSEEGLSAFVSNWRGLPPKWNLKAYLEAATGWVYSCTSVISDEIAGMTIRLYKRTKTGAEEINEHPILDIIYKINSFTTKFDHFWLTQSYLELAGEAPWLVDKDDNGIPIGIYLLRPDKLNIKFDKEKIIGKYVYEPSPGDKLEFDRDDIIFLRYPDPIRPLRGRGTLEAAARTYDLDKYAEEWNVNFFYNQARPDAVLTTDKKLTQDQLKMLENQWKKKFRGIDKHAKMAILGGGLKYDIVQLTQKDMEFLAQQRFSRDKILAIFRVPKPIIAISEDVNFANAKTAAYSFARWTIKPKMQRIVELLNEFLVPMFPNSESYYLGFDNPVPEDLELKIKEYVAALGMNGWMTINEIRKKERLPLVEGGDEIYRPLAEFNIAGESRSAKMLGFRIRKDTEKKDYPKEWLMLNARTGKERKKIEETNKLIKEVVKAHLSRKKNHSNKKVSPKVKKKANKTKRSNKSAKTPKRLIVNEKIFWNKQIAIEERYERIVIKKLKSLFKEQKEDVLRKLQTQGTKCLGKVSKIDAKGVHGRKYRYLEELKLSIPEVLLDIKEESKKFIKRFYPTTYNLIKDIGKYVFSVAGFSGEFDVKSTNVGEYLNGYSTKLAKEITETTNRAIREALKAGISEGEGANKLASRIELVFDKVSKARINNIARTECSRTVNFTTVESYRQSGVVEAKEWICSFDNRTCQYCAQMNGKIVGLNENFFDKGSIFEGDEGGVLRLDYEDIKHPPLHPRCRCTIIPIVWE